MATYGLYRILKVIKVPVIGDIAEQHVGSAWLPVAERTDEEWRKIAQAYHGDRIKLPPDLVEHDVENRQPRFSKLIVMNLRQSQSNLAGYTDDQIYNAYQDWSTSTDSDDESLIKEWIT